MKKFAEPARKGEIDWRTWRSNIVLLLMFGGIGFLLSSGNLYVAVFTFIFFAPLYEWKRIETPHEEIVTKPLSKRGKEAMNDYLVKIGQISDKS